MPVDPYEIFRKNSGRMSESSVNDLWAGQVDALREWHVNRNLKDVCLVLNTGAGKTLIGALVSQSLVNETRGKVLYACGSIQLVEQTREKFESYGLKPTTYYNRKFSNENYDQCQAVCITTYQAIFNGRSKFFNEDIEAIIFDDAHTAEGMIKNHFSLDIRRQQFSELYDSLCSIFQPYYHKVGKAGTFAEIRSGQNAKVELIHPSEVASNKSTICSLLEKGGVSENTDTLFSWTYLKDHIDICSIYISSGIIQITPPFIPVSRLSYFNSEIRRVYLTATMLGEDAFIRTFSKLPDKVIAPDTPAGQCERLILFPAKSSNVADDLMAAKELVKAEKTLIITPNNAAASRWEDCAELPSRNEFPESMQAFKDSNSDDKIVVAARYDGIDLPGDTCRVLVLDGLPMGSSLIDKYLWESLKLAKSLRSIIACRIVQSLGRISRGLSDYGVVLVVERDYVKWLSQPKNQAALPEFIQKQFMLGADISSDAEGYQDLKKVMMQCLERDDEWLDVYETYMEDCEVEPEELDSDELVRFAKSEVKFSEYLWERNYAEAAKCLTEILNYAFAISDSLGAWYAFWLGYCYELAGDEQNSNILYRRATGVSKNLPKIFGAVESIDSLPTNQMVEIVNQFEVAGGSNLNIPKNMALNLQGLSDGASSNATEESLRALGQYLGLDSSRPDKEVGVGPDVLWVSDNIAFCIEAKSGKKIKGSYTKRNVGQLMNHIQWVQDEHPEVEKIIPVFVGPEVSVSDSASPTEDMCVAGLAKFKVLGEELVAAYQDIASKAIPLDLSEHVRETLDLRGWNWADLSQNFDYVALK